MEDFLARSGQGRCHDFRETADIIAKVTTIVLCYVMCMYMYTVKVSRLGSITVFTDMQPTNIYINVFAIKDTSESF